VKTHNTGPTGQSLTLTLTLPQILTLTSPWSTLQVL